MHTKLAHVVKKMRYIGNTLDLAKLKEFAKILS